MNKKIENLIRAGKKAVVNSAIWQFHVRFYKFFFDLGIKKFVFPRLNDLEPGLNHPTDPSVFQIEQVTIIAPYNTSEYIKLVLNKYSRAILPLLFKSVIGIYLAIFVTVGIGARTPFIMDTLFFVIYMLAVVWFFLLSFIAFWGYAQPIQLRTAVWNKELSAAYSHEFTTWKIESASQEISHPDERIEKLKEQAEAISQKIYLLSNDITQKETIAKEKEELNIQFRETLNDLEREKRKMLLGEVVKVSRDDEKEYREYLEKKNEPRSILRDLSINLLASFIGFLIGILGTWIWNSVFGCKWICP